MRVKKRILPTVLIPFTHQDGLRIPSADWDTTLHSTGHAAGCKPYKRMRGEWR